MKIKQFSKTASKFLSKNGPVILTGVSITSLASSIWFTATGTIKAIDIIKTLETTIPAYTDHDIPKKEIVKSCWKCYTPAFISATVSAACMIGATSINCKRNAVLASAYALSTDAFKAYKEKTEPLLSKKALQGIRDEEAKDERAKIEKNGITIIGEGKIFCVENLCHQSFRSTIADIDSAINRANEELLDEGYISLNGVYDYLGLSHTALGQSLGWEACDGLIKISYGSDLTEGKEPFLLVRFDTMPKKE